MEGVVEEKEKKRRREGGRRWRSEEGREEESARIGRCNSWKVGSVFFLPSPKTGEIMGAKGARVAAPRPEGKGGDESGGFSRKRFFSSPIEHRRPTTSGPDRYSKRVATALSSPRCVLACKLCLSGKEKWKKLSTRECARLVKVLRAPRLEKTIDTSASVVGPTFFESSIVGSVKKGRKVLLSVRASARYR